MLYSFVARTPPLKNYSFLYVLDQDRSYRFVLCKGETDHYFTNVPVGAQPQIKYDGMFELETLSLGDFDYQTPEQRNLNQTMTQKNGISYRVSVQGDPNYAIVQFPAYRGDRGWITPYGVNDASRFDLQNTLYISFQDPYFSAGSYFLSDNYGNNPLPAAISLIDNELNKYEIPESSMTLIGSSKGANIAAIASQFFSDNQLILSGYAMDLKAWITHGGQAHLDSALDYYGIEYPDAGRIFRDESEIKETHWFYSKSDAIANQGMEQYQATNLTSYASDEPHGVLYRVHEPEMRTLICQRRGIDLR